MLRRPAVSACTSMAAFSVSSSSTTSSASTGAPSSFSQRTSVASLMDSPSGGIRISTATSALQGLLEDRLLLGLMDLVRARRDASGLDAADVGEADVGPEQRREQRPHEPPRALVGRLLLHPADLARRGVTLDQRAHLVGGERVELLDADERHVVALLLASRGVERVEDLARADHEAARRRRRARVVERQPKAAVRELGERRYGLGVAQQALGRHHDERLAETAGGLPPPRAKNLRRGGPPDTPGLPRR